MATLSRRSLAFQLLSKANDHYAGIGQAKPISLSNIRAFHLERISDLGKQKSLYPHFLLCFNLRDSSPIQLILNNVSHRLEPGAYTLLFPHYLHSFENVQNHTGSTLFIAFETEDIEHIISIQGRIFPFTTRVESALTSFVEEYGTIGKTRSEQLIVLTAKFLLETIIMKESGSGIESSLALPTTLRTAMQRLAGDTIPTAVSIAKDTGISDAYLRRLFKRHMGVSFGQYLMEMRQDKARYLLSASDDSVSHIAELCGYASIYAFSRSFKTCNKCTPTVYRERNRPRRVSQG